MCGNPQEASETAQKIVLSEQQRKYQRCKRGLDFLTALCLMIVLSPLWLLAALALKLEDFRDPVIFRQKRVGLNGEAFTILKFRTMMTSAPSEMTTAEFADAGLYITRVGRFLRNTSIDELPQLVNVIKGEMSMLGPRPLILAEEKVHQERLRHGIYQIRPGISGLAQVHGRDVLNDDCKITWDKRYVEELSLRMDVGIFFSTFAAVLTRRGIVDRNAEKM